MVERLDVKKKQLRKASPPLSCIKLIFQISVSFKNESSFQSHFMPVIFPAVFIRMSFNNSLSVDSCRNTFEASSISKIGPDVLTEISLEIDLLRHESFPSSRLLRAFEKLSNITVDNLRSPIHNSVDDGLFLVLERRLSGG